LLIRDELSAPVTPDDVLTATEAVYGAIEVLESHYTDYRYKRPDVIADNVGAVPWCSAPGPAVPTSWTTSG
jgi:2-oxo-3-hexenedioate decarboxylase